ncbi:hypothetical protein RRG08_023020 [Elysia crispata]|uniref:Uncharacterized protein n=1 Tax=Elysia crispata TaxID=231223 RepID=A0AAE0XVI9_9GAST|nr:hypothetical protein RRG08_023020 [Elysia crispata]
MFHAACTMSRRLTGVGFQAFFRASRRSRRGSHRRPFPPGLRDPLVLSGEHLKKTVMSLLRPEGPPVLEKELVDREVLVLPPSQDPDGLRFALRCFLDCGPDVAFIDGDFAGLGKVEISPPGVSVVERELYCFPPAMLVLL